ncbi:MAG TPA: hypothetical protein VHZ09_03690 [Acidobacteriaceae bacterium]|jgi:hypothetical protein|nr:hypothetical protein [Acidobacteriaceae bacterium]
MATAVVTETMSRQALREALAIVEELKAASLEAEKVSANALAAVEQASAALFVFDDLDSQIAKANLRVLKGADPAIMDKAREAQRQRLLAREELAVAEATLELAKSEAGKAAEVLAIAERSKDALVIGVLEEQAGKVIAELDSINAKRRSLQTLLKGLLLGSQGYGWDLLPRASKASFLQNNAAKAGLPFSGLDDWEPLHRRISSALMYPVGESNLDPAREWWKRFADAVAENPAAEADPLPAPIPTPIILTRPTVPVV